MSCLIDRSVKIIFVSASSVNKNGKRRKIVLESCPTYALIRLRGSAESFPIAWEAIYEAAVRRHAENLRLEAEAEKAHKALKKKPTG
jgi:DNA gyrase inhibitor GyrI